MKKIVLLGVFAMVAFTASAQLSVIPKVGFTVSRFKASESDNSDSRLGFVLGAGLAYQLESAPLTIQPELLIIQKNQKYDAGSTTIKATTTWLEIPVMVKYAFGDDSQYYVNAGPSLGFALGGKYKGGSSEADIKFGNGEEDDLKATDFAFQLGGGVRVAEKFLIDLRYGIGLSNLAPKPVGDYNVKSRCLQITVGLPLSLD